MVAVEPPPPSRPGARPAPARAALLLKAADALEAKTPQFCEAVAAETGGTAMWAGFVMLAAGMLREAALLTTQVAGEVIPSDVPGSLAMGVRQPAGVALGIAPWNAPIITRRAPSPRHWPAAIR